MNRKISASIMLGVLAVGLLCLAFGLLAYFAMGDVVSFVLSLFAISAGAIMSGVAVVTLIVVFIVHLVCRGNKSAENAPEQTAEVEQANA